MSLSTISDRQYLQLITKILHIFFLIFLFTSYGIVHVLENILRRIFSCKRQICYFCYISFFLRSALCGAHIPATADFVLNISLMCYDYLLHLLKNNTNVPN